ncbi:hypothetical protein ACFSBZ_12050 [Amnibacterium flavum]|uniref:Uncharacterized protein n=1 Tax=Amnibacterium flavum TaxID=2173173 RepID=A0A2V1HSG5_9MICO|nr:hypothetical protein [Amnibacterium flavum]PVZ95533.1 hypothetical protein DDQ50_03265 [Amnibacterium flavum]
MSAADTPQTLDPLGGITARFTVFLATAIAVVIATTFTAMSVPEITRPWAVIGSLASLAAALTVLVVSASPFRAPFRRGSAIAFLALLALAVWLEAVSKLGADTHVLNDWGALVVAILMFPLGCYRPARELVVAAVVMAFVVAGVPLVHMHSLVTDVPPLVFSIVITAPVLGGGIAAAAFSRSLVGDLTAWRETARSAASVGTQSATLTAEIEADRLALLSREILPLLSSVVSTGRLTSHESDHARMLASSLRSTLVDETDRSWLEELGVDLSDPDRESDAWQPAQRAALRAVLERLAESWPGVDVVLTVTAQDGETHVDLVGTFTRGTRPSRNQLAPYVATMRMVFDRVAVRSSQDTVQMHFEVPNPI